MGIDPKIDVYTKANMIICIFVAHVCNSRTISWDSGGGGRGKNDNQQY
jgi:hypothetical protein